MVFTFLKVFGTEGRYASALYSAASKQKALDAVEKDLKSFGEALKKDSRLNSQQTFVQNVQFSKVLVDYRFSEFMADPSVKKNVKADGLAGACDRLKMNPLSKNLFTTMADNGRHTHFEAVISAFSTIMSAHRGEVVCEVTTAKVKINLLKPSMLPMAESSY